MLRASDLIKEVKISLVNLYGLYLGPKRQIETVLKRQIQSVLKKRILTVLKKGKLCHTNNLLRKTVSRHNRAPKLPRKTVDCVKFSFLILPV